MRPFAQICLAVAALALAHCVAAQSVTMRGCKVTPNNYPAPYPTPEVYGGSVTLPAQSYLNYMSCSFILNLTQVTPKVFDTTLTFSSFQTELNWDFVEVYNGCDPSRPPVRPVNSTDGPCSLISDFPFQIMRKSGIYRFAAAAFKQPAALQP